MSIGRGKLRRVPQRDQWAGMSVLSFGPKVRGPRTHSIMLKKSDNVTPIAIRNGSGKSLKGGLLVLSGCGGVSLRTAGWRGFSRGIPGLLLLDFAQEGPPRRGVQRFRPLKAARRIRTAAQRSEFVPRAATTGASPVHPRANLFSQFWGRRAVRVGSCH